METKIPTLAGMVLGYVTNLITGNIWVAVATAVMTGAAAYIGQQITKYAHTKLKKKKK